MADYGFTMMPLSVTSNISGSFLSEVEYNGKGTFESVYDVAKLSGGSPYISAYRSGNGVRIQCTATEDGSYSASVRVYLLVDDSGVEVYPEQVFTFTYIISSTIRKVTIPEISPRGYEYTGSDIVAQIINPDSQYINQTGEIIGKEVKQYTIYWQLKDTNTTTWSDNSISIKSQTWNINRAPSYWDSEPTGRSLKYNGIKQKLINEGRSVGGTAYYKIGATGTYSPNIPEASEEGDYRIYYKIVADNNHLDSAESYVITTISSGELLVPKPSISIIYYSYTGDPIIPNYINYNSQYMTYDGDYSSTEIGEKNITFSLKSGYKWNDSSTIPVTITWYITEPVSGIPKPYLEEKHYRHTGERITPNYINYNPQYMAYDGDYSSRFEGIKTITFTLIEGNIWEDGTTDPVIIKWYIETTGTYQDLEATPNEITFGQIETYVVTVTGNYGTLTARTNPHNSHIVIQIMSDHKVAIASTSRYHGVANVTITAANSGDYLANTIDIPIYFTGTTNTLTFEEQPNNITAGEISDRPVRALSSVGFNVVYSIQNMTGIAELTRDNRIKGISQGQVKIIATSNIPWSNTIADPTHFQTISIEYIVTIEAGNYDLYDVYISNGTNWEKYETYISDGTKWEKMMAFIFK